MIYIKILSKVIKLTKKKKKKKSGQDDRWKKVEML